MHRRERETKPLVYARYIHCYLTVIVFLTSSCREAPNPSAGSRIVDFPIDSAVTVIGLQPPADPAAEIGLIHAGRISPSGAYIALLDAIPPFVKIADRSGRILMVLGPEGQGPGELKQPRAIALSDSVIFVADVGRAALFSIAGEFIGFVDLGGVNALAATYACAGDWLIYGPLLQPSGGRGSEAPSALWVHRVRLRDGELVRVASAFEAPLPQRMAFGGRPTGLVVGPRSVFIQHGTGEGVTVIEVKCQGSPPEITAAVLEQWNSDSGSLPATPLGIVHVDGALYGAWLGGNSTSLVVTQTDANDHGGEAQDGVALSQPMSFLLDSRPSVGVLLSGQLPFPHVQLIAEQEWHRRLKVE